MIEKSYEDVILMQQESEVDDCKDCPFKSECKNQCLQEREVYLFI